MQACDSMVSELDCQSWGTGFKPWLQQKLPLILHTQVLNHWSQLSLWVGTSGAYLLNEMTGNCPHLADAVKIEGIKFN